MNARTYLILSLLLATGSAYTQTLNNDLSALSVIQEHVSTRRVSSFDKTGGNDDNVQIADGERKTIFDVKGAGMINHIWITLAPDPGALSRNDIILRMYWDGKPYPSVESPIGPFFGQGWNESYEYTSLPLSASPVNGKGMVCYFAMPFSNGARIELENQTGRKVDACYYQIDYTVMDKLPANAGRFHSWFNRQVTGASKEEEENEWSVFGKQLPNKTGKDNYVIADIKGKGQFVGVNYYVHSPTTIWYGEGDDMIYIDGDTTPTLYGTGTEDYFNSSWCPKSIYSHPYYGYARVNNDNGWLGRTHMYRFNIADPIYFNRSLKFTIEHGHNNVLTLDLASVAYWYQSEATAVPAIPDKAGRKLKPMIGPVDIHRWRNEWRKNHGNEPTLWGN